MFSLVSFSICLSWVPLICHCLLLHLLAGSSAHILRKTCSDVSVNFHFKEHKHTPPVSRGRPLFSANKPSLIVWKPSLSTLCTASEARLCIPQLIHMGELSHEQQLFMLLNKVRKQHAINLGDEILHFSFLGRKRRAGQTLRDEQSTRRDYMNHRVHPLSTTR